MNEAQEIAELEGSASEVRISRAAPVREAFPELRGAPVVPVRAAAVVAAGGFMAGAAVAGVLGRRRRGGTLTRGRRPGAALARGLRRRPRAPSQPAAALEIVATRKLLIDVHLLAPPSAGS